MKLFVIAFCAVTAVTADVSHLTGHGYNYDKPSVTFSLPQQTPGNQQKLSGPNADYLPPQLPHIDSISSAVPQQQHLPSVQGPPNDYLPPTQHQYPMPVQTPVQHVQDVQGPSSDYLPPTQQQYSSPVQTPVHHHEQYFAHHQAQVHEQENPQTLAPVAHQQASQAPPGEYLPPQSQHSTTATVASIQHQHISQPVALQHLQNFAHIQAPVQQQEHSQPIVPVHSQQTAQVPSNEYLPAQQQQFPPVLTPHTHRDETSHSIFPSQTIYSGPSQDPVHHQDNFQSIQGSSNGYLPPQNQPQHQFLGAIQHQETPQFSVEHHKDIQSIHTPIPQHLPSQPQYSGPAEVAAHHQDHALPQAAPFNDYLPPQQKYSTPTQGPVIVHHQQLSQSISPVSNDYLPPNEQHHHDHHHHHHHNHEPQQIEQNPESQPDGYHYDAPAKPFRF